MVYQKSASIVKKPAKPICVKCGNFLKEKIRELYTIQFTIVAGRGHISRQLKSSDFSKMLMYFKTFRPKPGFLVDQAPNINSFTGELFATVRPNAGGSWTSGDSSSEEMTSSMQSSSSESRWMTTSCRSSR